MKKVLEDFEDKQITCCICESVFTWSRGEQLFYHDRKLKPPRRCKACRPSGRKDGECD